MKETGDDIGKKLPYHETEGYLDALIDRATEEAVRRRAAASGARRWRMRAASISAGVALALGIGLTVLNSHEAQRVLAPAQPQSPIDEFLNTLTDEEVAQLPYYEIEEIPEY